MQNLLSQQQVHKDFLKKLAFLKKAFSQGYFTEIKIKYLDHFSEMGNILPVRPCILPLGQATLKRNDSYLLLILSIACQQPLSIEVN